MALAFDHAQSLIEVGGGQDAVDCWELLNAIREEEATERGIAYPSIARASGREDLGEGVQVGISLALLDEWRLHFLPGAYIAKVAGGNLTGGPAGDPVAYSPGVQVLLIQSASATVVTVTTGGSALTQAEHDRLYSTARADQAALEATAQAIRARVESGALESTVQAIKAATDDLTAEAFGRWVLNFDSDTLTLYRPNGEVLKTFNLTRSGATPQVYVGREPA